MKKNMIVGIVIAVIVVAGGAYALLHKSSKPASSTAASSSSSSKAPAVNNTVLITKTDSTVGQYLAEPNGQALYTYGGDSSGVSNCTGSCLAQWPAYQDKGPTTGLPAGISTIKRSDNGQTQYTYNGMPLYTFVSDQPGQVTGDGVQNFSVAKPAASSSSSSSGSSQSTTPAPDQSSAPSYNY